MNWAFRRLSILTFAFICGLDFMEMTSGTSSSSSGEESCGIQVVAPHLCPHQSNDSMPCCYEMVQERKIRTFKSRTSYQEESIAHLQAEIRHGNLSGGGGGLNEKPILVEDSISGRSVVCVAPGYHLCYFREVTTKNDTRVCSLVKPKALLSKEDRCFEFPICKTDDMCSKTDRPVLIISRPTFYICLVLAFIFMNTAIWAGLRKCGGKDPQPGRL